MLRTYLSIIASMMLSGNAIAQGDISVQQKFDDLKSKGIFIGSGNDPANPEMPIPRAEFVRITALVLNLKPEEQNLSQTTVWQDIDLANFGNFVEEISRRSGASGTFSADMKPDEFALAIQRVLAAAENDLAMANIINMNTVLSSIGSGFFATDAAGDDASLDNGSVASTLLIALNGNRQLFAQLRPDLIEYLPPNGEESNTSIRPTLVTMRTLLAPGQQSSGGNKEPKDTFNALADLIQQVQSELSVARQLVSNARDEGATNGSTGDQGPARTGQSQEHADYVWRLEQEARARQQQLELERQQQAQAAVDRKMQEYLERKGAPGQQTSWPAWVSADVRYAPLLQARVTELSSFQAFYSGEARGTDGYGNDVIGEFDAVLSGGHVGGVYTGTILGLNFTSVPFQSNREFIADVDAGLSNVTSGSSAYYSGGTLRGNFYGPGAGGLGGTFELIGDSDPDMLGHFVGVIP